MIAGSVPGTIRRFFPSCYFHQRSNIKRNVIILAATNAICPEINVQYWQKLLIIEVQNPTMSI